MPRSLSLLFHCLAACLLAGAIIQCGPARADLWPTSGGEPGRTIEVTTLADSGPGSLRAAVAASGRRIVVFKVAGEIWLTGTLHIEQPFLTVAGETAPSPGITLMGDRIRLRAHDVILRHLRVRVGALPTGWDPENRDGIAIGGSEDGSDPGYNVLIEHCSVSWSIDELVQIWGKNSHDIVVRDSILSEALNNSIHPKGPHSMGLLVGQHTTNVLVQRNLFAHNNGRNPVLDHSAEAMIINNLIYNPGYYAIHFYSLPSDPGGASRATVVGNYAIRGPSTSSTRAIMTAFSQGPNEGSEIYYNDNVSEGMVAFDTTERVKGSTTPPPFPFVSEPPIWLPVVDILPSSMVPAYVLNNAGARPWDRDAVDARIVSEVRTRTGRMRDTPTDPRLAAP